MAAVVLYDGQCDLCSRSAKLLERLDTGRRVLVEDYHGRELRELHPELTRRACSEGLRLVEEGGRLSSGFDVLRRLSLKLPLLWPIAPFLFLPGAGIVGRRLYACVASMRKTGGR